MHKDTALNKIKRDIGRKYKTLTRAAPELGVSRQSLSEALNGHIDPIPEYLLEFSGLTLTTKHIYGSNK
jgi:hypothetical protein